MQTRTYDGIAQIRFTDAPEFDAWVLLHSPNRVQADVASLLTDRTIPAVPDDRQMSPSIANSGH